MALSSILCVSLKVYLWYTHCRGQPYFQPLSRKLSGTYLLINVSLIKVSVNCKLTVIVRPSVNLVGVSKHSITDNAKYYFVKKYIIYCHIFATGIFV